MHKSQVHGHEANKGGDPLDWAMMIDAEVELADMQSSKPQKFKFMKFCRGLKDERLYEKITAMDTRGWEEAKTLIRKHTATASLKADVEHKAGGSGHMVNSISRAASKSPSQSSGQRRRYENEQRGRSRTPQGKGPLREDRRDSSKGRRSRESSNTRICFNYEKVTGHFANTCPEPKREDGKIEVRITPYPRSRESSRNRGGASQGSKTHRTNMLRATWREEPL